jgi:hypothetical protein
MGRSEVADNFFSLYFPEQLDSQLFSLYFPEQVAGNFFSLYQPERVDRRLVAGAQLYRPGISRRCRPVSFYWQREAGKVCGGEPKGGRSTSRLIW